MTNEKTPLFLVVGLIFLITFAAAAMHLVVLVVLHMALVERLV